MSAKKCIEVILFRLKIQYKSMGVLFYVPLIFNWLVIPSIVLISYHKTPDVETAYDTISTFSQIFSVILSVVWSIFLQNEYIEAQGNETLFLNDRNQIKNVSAWMLIYMLQLLLPFSVYGALIDSVIWAEYLKINIYIFFITGLTYFLIYFIKSNTFALLVLILYTAFSVTPIFENFPIGFMDTRFFSIDIFKSKTVFFLLCGVLLWIIGFFLNKFFRKYR